MENKKTEKMAFAVRITFVSITRIYGKKILF